MFAIFIFIVFVYMMSTMFFTVKILNEILNEIRELKETKKEDKRIRQHSRIATKTYATPLKTYNHDYDIYKDKKSGLYIPRKPSRGITIKGDEE